MRARRLTKANHRIRTDFSQKPMARLFVKKDVLRLPEPVYHANNELRAAAKEGDIERVKAALGRGANPTLRDASGRLPLHLAVESRNVEIVALLASCPGVEVDSVDVDGLSPFHYGCIRFPEHSLEAADDVQCLQLLNERGAMANLKVHA